MKSTFKMTLFIAGFALFSILFVACGYSDSDEPARPAPAPAPCSSGTRPRHPRQLRLRRTVNDPAAARARTASEGTTGPNACTGCRLHNGK